MTRIKTAGIAAGFALALVVGILAGGAMSTVSAEIVEHGPAGGVVLCPNGDPVALADCIEEYRASFAPEADASKGEDESLDGEPETVQCSIVDGCTVEVVDAEGTVIKVMNITFTDAGDAEIDAEE